MRSYIVRRDCDVRTFDGMQVDEDLCDDDGGVDEDEDGEQDLHGTALQQPQRLAATPVDSSSSVL